MEIAPGVQLWSVTNVDLPLPETTKEETLETTAEVPDMMDTVKMLNHWNQMAQSLKLKEDA